MMQPWLSALARKVLSGRQLQATPRRGCRRSVRLRCELLEDRVLMYAANFGQVEPMPPAPATSPAVFWWTQIAPSYTEEIQELVRSVQWNVPGLNQLLADLRWPAAPPPTSSGFSPD